METKQTLGSFAPSYAGGAATTKNISELDAVLISYPLSERKGTDSNGQDFSYYVVEANHFEYRMPKSMITALKETLEVRPDLKSFKITRKGTTKDDTKYTFIALE